MTLARRSTRIITPVLEELPEFEVELPARCRAPRKVNLVEPIPDVHTQRSEWAQSSHSEAEAPEQPSGVELSRLVPDIAAFEESVHVERLADSETDLASSDEKRITERGPARSGIVATGIVSAWSDRELVVTTQLFAVLRSTERKRLRREEWPRIPEY